MKVPIFNKNGSWILERGKTIEIDENGDEYGYDGEEEEEKEEYYEENDLKDSLNLNYLSALFNLDYLQKDIILYI